MRLFALPGVEFTHLGYIDAQTLLSADYQRGHSLRVWDLAGLPGPRDVPAAQFRAVWPLFKPGAGRFLRGQGFWPDGADLPPPLPGDPGRFHPLLSPLHLWGAVAFAGDGATVLHDETVVTRGFYSTRFHVRDASGITSHFHAPTCLGPRGAFSPDGRLVAMSGGDPAVSVWDVADRREVARLDQPDKVLGLAFVAPDRLAVAAGRTVRVWGVDGKPPVKLGTFRKYAVALAVSPDLRLVAGAGRDGLVRVWDTTTGRLAAEYDWGVGEVRAVAFSPDGTTAAAAGKTGLVVWDID